MTRQTAPQPDSGEAQLTFSVVIDKTPGMSLGIDVAFSSAIVWMRQGIFVKTVFDGGSVAAWNALNEESLQVQPGDLIFQVNAIHGDILSMIQEMKVKQRLTLHILRRAGNTATQQTGPSPPLPPEPAPLTSGPPGSLQDTAEAPADTNASVEATVEPNTSELPRMPAEAGTFENAVANRPALSTAHGIAEEGQVHEASAEASEEQLSEAESGDSDSIRDSRKPATVDELLPQLRSLEDGTLAGIIVVALEQRPWLYEAVLGERGPACNN
eukprot:CAMPEP_0172807730 /NCGR_PEP_ID=MMETSP1075-20121228/7206_1 /TAXON_ID=2916 /ORGANISM="Ceratium fusus, Strain PA161109" /LENGTH=269 /DNA_ID=CAMNT_0013646759 /DNA_START=156 /DNA_END=962 /DNA_ORIENTATION=+